MKKRFVAFLLVLIMVLGMLPVSAMAASNSTVVLHPSVNNTVTGVKVKAGDKIDGHTVTSISGYDITVDLGKYNVNNDTFRLPYAKDIWEGVDNNKVDYISWAGSGSNKRSEGASAYLANGKNTAYYYFKGATPTYNDPQVNCYVLYIDDSINPLGYKSNLWKKKSFTCALHGASCPDSVGSHAITVASVKAASQELLAAKVLEEGYELVGWSKTDGYNPVIYSFDAGGNTVIQTKDNDTIYFVAKKPAPTIPTPSASNINWNGFTVPVECVTDVTPDHGVQNINYIVGSAGTPSHTAGATTATVTLNKGDYITAYGNIYNVAHEANDATPLTVTLSWNGASWMPQTLITSVKVKCTPTEVEPSAPTDNDLGALDGVRVHCTTSTAHEEKTYKIKPDAIARRSEKVENGEYTIWLNVQPYVDAYNSDYPNTGHTSAEATNTVQLVLEYDGASSKWQVKGGDLANIEVECDTTSEIPEPTKDEIFNALTGLVTVTCINRFWKDGNNNMDCGQGQYAARAGIVGQNYKLEQGENATTWVVTFPVTNFVKSFKQNPAHNLYTKETLSWYIRWNGNTWTSEPVERGVDDLVKLTHAPTDWREVAKIATGGKDDCIHTLCVNSGLNVCDYGITVPFVNFKEDVVSVEPEAGRPGSYIATFKVDKFVDICAKACNDKNFPDAPRTHKLLTQDTVQWRLYATPEEDANDNIGNNVPNHVWAADPVTPGTDDVCTIAHNWVVTFNPDNGEPAFTRDVEYEGKATEPAAPKKTGYTFDGWYLDEAEEPFSFDTTITSDITLTAKWSPATVYLFVQPVDSQGVKLVDKDTSKDKSQQNVGLALNADTLARAGFTASKYGGYNHSNKEWITVGKMTTTQDLPTFQ